MKKSSLLQLTESVSTKWGPLTSELVASVREHMRALAETPATEDWLAQLHEEAPETRQLYRDPEHGFLLLAHTESAGLYRCPHDHGRGWVAYAVQQGETEMSSYARVVDEDGKTRLVKRGSSVVRPGQVKVYLPGDIHDTRCIGGPLVLFRLTSRDLKKEDVKRYAQRDGIWQEAPSCTV